MGCFCDEELVEFLEFLPGECLRGQVVPGMQNAIVLHIRTRDDEGSVPDLFFFSPVCVQSPAAISCFYLVKYWGRNENTLCSRRVLGFLCRAVLITSCHSV